MTIAECLTIKGVIYILVRTMNRWCQSCNATAAKRVLVASHSA